MIKDGSTKVNIKILENQIWPKNKYFFFLFSCFYLIDLCGIDWSTIKSLNHLRSKLQYELLYWILGPTSKTRRVVPGHAWTSLHSTDSEGQ